MNKISHYCSLMLAVFLLGQSLAFADEDRSVAPFNQDSQAAYQNEAEDDCGSNNSYGCQTCACRFCIPETDCQFARRCGLMGIWFPEGPPIFRPFIADPRQVTNSVGWRFNDDVLGKNIIPVSYGDILPIYRWCDIWCFRGDLELDLEGCLWAVFDPLHESSPLVDADYFIGIAVTYAFDDLAIRLRGYHISTHIGDEFLLNHPHFDRRNPSIEVLDLFAAYNFTKDIRLYAGLGWVCCQDDSFRCGEYYLNAGVELRLFELGYMDYCNRLYGVPFLAMHFRYASDFTRHLDATYAIGWEWGKVSVLCRRFRIFLEYHDGYSVEGQFCKNSSNYLSIRATYGF